MIKLIVSDFDGTLMPYGESAVPQGVKDRLREALERGITVAVSSGRTYGELADLLPEFADKLYFICCDGAYYLKDGKTLYEKKIEPADMTQFFACADKDFAFVLHGAKNNYSVGNLPSEALRFGATPIAHANDIKEKIFKLTTYRAEIKLAPYSGLRTHWDGGKNASAQFVNRFANKGTALSDLQTRLMLTKFDTACIGDSGNDVAMMRNAKYSFAVGNRSKELAEVTQAKVANAQEALDFCLPLGKRE